MTLSQHFSHWCRQLAAALEQAELDLWAPAPADAAVTLSESSRH